MTENKLNNSSITEQFYQYMIDNDLKKVNIYDFLNHIRPQYDVSDEEFASIMSYFYTDLNLDGRFVCVEDGSWALKDNLSVEEVKNFVEPSISTFSLEEYDYDEEEVSEEYEEVTDELDSLQSTEDADDEDSDLYGFSDGDDITSNFSIESEEDEY